MRDRRVQIFLRGLGLWLLGALAIALPLSQINLIRFYRLEKNGVRTNGRVMQLQPSSHQSVYYSFVVAGTTYSGTGRAGFGNPEFRSMTVGQRVIVYYLPTKPWICCVGIPDRLIENEVPPIVLAGVVFPLFAMTVYCWRLPRFRRWLLYEGTQPQAARGGSSIG